MPTAKFISTTDFINEPFKIAQDKYSSASLKGFIDLYEYEFLRLVIGDKLYTELIADLTGAVPNSPKFLALLNGDTYTNIEGKFVRYDGLISAMKFYIWAMTIRKSNYVNTIAGTVVNANENSVKANVSSLCAVAYNNSCELGRNANYFIQHFEFYESEASSIALQSGTTYLVSITDTKYLKNGDTVTINNIDYVIANLVDIVSFTVESATDITENNVQVDWTIFGEFDTEPLEYSFLHI